MPAEALDARRLLSELSDAWAALAHPEHAGTEGVLRACAMTLLVLTRTDGDPQALGETLARLTPEHPSRLIVVRIGAGAEGGLEGRVLVQCWRPFGRRQQICAEQIELVAAPDKLPHVPPLLSALLVADLPVVLYAHDPAALELAACAPLLNLAGRIITDSTATPPALALDRLDRLKDRCASVGDLAWARTTRWRQALYHLFRGEAGQARLAGVQSIRVSFSGPGLPCPALYLGAWLAAALEGATLAWRELPPQAGETGPLRRAAIREVSLEGDGWQACLRRTSDCGVEVALDGVRSHVVFPMLGEEQLLREELLVLGADPHFESALGRAREALSLQLELPS